jgi:acyl carrier protein
MKDRKFEERVYEIIARKFGVSVEAITPATSLFNELSTDSLDIVEVIMVLEREFNVKIRDEDLEKLGKIDDLVNYIREKMSLSPVGKAGDGVGSL